MQVTEDAIGVIHLVEDVEVVLPSRSLHFDLAQFPLQARDGEVVRRLVVFGVERVARVVGRVHHLLGLGEGLEATEEIRTRVLHRPLDLLHQVQGPLHLPLSVRGLEVVVERLHVGGEGGALVVGVELRLQVRLLLLALDHLPRH
eukprot:767951-Hanusia_phi.AAC.4